jgi:hypothetical protein
MMANASIVVEAAQPQGIQITNGEFTAFVDPQFGVQKANSTQVVTLPSFTNSALRIVNCAFWGPSNSNAVIQGTGLVAFSASTLSYWDPKNSGEFSIVAHQGSSLMVQGCEFQKDANHIWLEKGVRRASIVGNMFAGKMRVKDNGAINIATGLNVGE